MKQVQKLLSTAAFAVFCAGSALAQSAPPPADGGSHRHWMEAHNGDRTQFHARMCNGLYAHHVGMVAELGARLDLTESQRPAFERWKSVVLDGAKSHETECLAHHRDMDHPPTVLEREAHMRERLKDRLAQMDAQQPALTALYNALTPQQQRELDHMGHGGMHEGFGMHRGMGGMHGWHHDGGPEEQGPPPGGATGGPEGGPDHT